MPRLNLAIGEEVPITNKRSAIRKRIVDYARNGATGSSAFRLGTHVAAAALFVLPFVVFFYNVFGYGANIPIQDDYHILLSFIHAWLQTRSLTDRFGLLVAQQNEHRVVLDRLAALSEYYLSGKVNFTVLTVFGTIGWVLLVLLLSFYLMKKQGLALSELVPVPYLLLVFWQFNNMFMATAAIAFYWEIFFSFALFVCLAEKKIVAACLLFAMALFTSANGLVLLPLGVAYLLLFKTRRDALIYSLSCLLFTTLFFTNYHVYTALSLTGALHNLGTLITFPLAFVGNVYPSVPIALILGAVAWIALIYFILRNAGDHVLLLTAAWILATSVQAAVARYDFGLEMAVSSRYAPYSLLGLVLIYVWTLGVSREAPSGLFQPRYVTLLVAIVAATLFFESVYAAESAGTFAEMRQDKIAGLSLMAENGDTSGLTIFDQYKNNAGQILVAAQESGFYDYMNVLNLRLPATTLVTIDAQAAYLGNIDVFDGMHIVGWAVIPHVDSARSALFVVLRSPQQTLGLRPTETTRRDVSYAYNERLYDHSGYDAYLAAYAVPSGNYEIGIFIENGDKQAIYWSGKHYMVP